MQEIEKNGLRLHRVLSSVAPVSELQDVLSVSLERWLEIVRDYLRNTSLEASAQVVAYLDYEVLIGTCEQGSFLFHEDKTFLPRAVQRLRLFNLEEELFLWRSGIALKGRLRKDNRGESTDAVDACQILFGTDVESCGAFTRIFEERGTSILLPGSFDVDQKKKRVALHTRNYVGYNELGQAGYVDCRFLRFVQLPEGEKK